MASLSRIHAVVVHYRTPGLLRECLASLRAQDPQPTEIVVVDTSAYSNGAMAWVGEIGAVRWVPTTSNIGFAAAANLGAAGAHGDAILVMNGDASLEPGALAAMASRLSHEPRCAIVAPRMLDADGELVHNARGFPSLATGLMGRTSPLTAALLRVGRVPRQLSWSGSSEARPVDWAAGACLLVRRSDWLALGGFDRGYWMYWEDADLCRRARDLGRATWFEPQAVCMHVTGASGRTPRTVQSFHESAALYYERHLARSAVERLLARGALGLRARLISRRLAS